MQEKELIERSRQGDEEAFGELMHLYEKKIYHLCYQIIHDEELAQDLTQETFVHAYQHLDSFRMESLFYTWLYKIARNLSLNLLRKKKHIELELKEEWLIPEKSPSKESSEEWNAALEEALKTLSSKQRVVFEMFDIQKMSHKEIAAQLNISPGTVRSRLFYARKNIRTYLTDIEQIG